MAVLAEAVSVVFRSDRLEAIWPGGVAAFLAQRPNESACEDGLIVRVGFMGPRGAAAFIAHCEAFGLVHHGPDAYAYDFVIVDQSIGLCRPCEWLEFGEVTVEGNTVRVVRMTGDDRQLLMCPPGWRFERSLSQRHIYTPEGSTVSSLRFLREENGIGYYLNTLTNRVVYSTEPVPDAAT